MAITKVTEGVRTLGTGEVLTANMDTDPTNASNLSSGDVPLAQLGNVDTSGITANQDDIALLGFKVAANGSLARYNLVDQSIDAFEDASGVDASGSTGESRNASGKYYSGTAPATPAGDGTITTYTDSGTDYVVHSFLADGDFIANGVGTADILLVAGGGAGGAYNAGGGGAGGFRAPTGMTIPDATHAVVIGAGGTSVTDGPSTSGADSTFGALLSATGGGVGGGTGTTSPPSGQGGDGGSGGGGGKAGGITGVIGSGNEGGYSPVEGYDGALGVSSPNRRGGGGGGSSALGNTPSGTGGAFTNNDFRTGVDVAYAAGGGGGARGGGAGAGGGASAGAGGDNATGTSASANTGSGGGGGGAQPGGAGTKHAGGAGGSGIAVLRFEDGAFKSINDMTLVSNAVTAESAPTTGDLVITYTNGIGTATINTDIKAYISRDGSAYTSAVTLVDQGDTGGHTILTANGVDLSGVTSGTSMRWKIETLNQSASKETRIQAVSLGWS